MEDRKKKYNATYYEKHKDKIKEYHRKNYAKYIKCECGDSVSQWNLSRHKKSKKHMVKLGGNLDGISLCEYCKLPFKPKEKRKSYHKKCLDKKQIIEEYKQMCENHGINANFA